APARGLQLGQHARPRGRPLDAGRADRAQGRAVRRAPQQGRADALRPMSEKPQQPAGPMMVDQLRYMAEVLPDELGYVDLDTQQALTFREWDDRSNQVAHWLVANGVQKGDRVSIALPNDYCLRWIVAYAAVHKA